MARPKKIKLPNKYDRDENGNFTRVENGLDIEELIRPSDIIVDFVGNRISGSKGLWMPQYKNDKGEILKGHTFYSLHLLVELWVLKQTETGVRLVKVAEHNSKTRKLELI